MGLKIYIERDIERLKNLFIENFSNKKKSLFDEQLIIVPNINVKKYIELQYANIKSIALGLNILYLESGLFYILKKILEIDEKIIFINDQDNIIYLQLLVILVLIKFCDEENIKILSNAYYYKNDQENKTEKIDYSYLWGLSEKISYYIREYQYQKPEIIEKWENGELFFQKDNKNQQKNNYEQVLSDNIFFDEKIEKAYNFIYQKIFGNGGFLNKINTNKEEIKLTTYYNFIKENLFNNIDISNKLAGYVNEKFGTNFTLYIFGISQISTFHLEIIFELSKYMNIEIYQLSYYSDNIDSNEDFIKKYSKAMAKYTNNFNNILNKVLKLEFSQILENNSYLEKGEKEKIEQGEKKDFESFKDKKNSVLQILKNSIKNSLDKNDFNLTKINQDQTIQVIGCPTIYREIETIYNSILYNLHNDPDLKLTDIAILVPDMKKYVYYIKNVFDNYKVIPYNLNDFSIAYETNFYKAIYQFFELYDSDFRKDKVLKLIRNPLFIKKFDIENINIEKIESLINELNIYYCYDLSEKKRISKNDSIAYIWEFGLTRLFLSKLIFNENLIDNEYENIFSIKNDIVYDNENLNKILKIFYDIFYFFKDEKYKTEKNGFYNYCGEKLLSFINNFLEIDPEDKIEFELSLKTKELIKNLKKFEDVFGFDFNENYINIEFVKKYILSNIENIQGRKNSYLSNGIVISELRPMKPIPFKIIYIPGLTGIDYPGLPDNSSLDLRNIDKNNDEYIRKNEIDNYLFFETIMSAKEKLYLLYNSIDLEVDKEILPSQCIKDLISYLEEKILNEKFYIHNTNILLENFIYKEKNRDIQIGKNIGDLQQNFDKMDIKEELKEKLIKEHNFCHIPQKVKILKKIEETHSIRQSTKENEKQEQSKLYNQNFIQLFINKNENIDSNKIKINIKDVAEFFINPKEIFLKNKFGLSKTYYDKSINEIIEPFYIDKYEDKALLVDILLDKQKKENNENYNSSINKRSSIGKYPEKVYINKKIENIGAKIDKGLNNEINQKDIKNVIKNISFNNIYKDKYIIQCNIDKVIFDDNNIKLFVSEKEFEKKWFSNKFLFSNMLSYMVAKKIYNGKDLNVINLYYDDEKEKFEYIEYSIIELNNDFVEKIIDFYIKNIYDNKESLYTIYTDFFESELKKTKMNEKGNYFNEKSEENEQEEDALYQSYLEYIEKKDFQNNDYYLNFKIEDDKYLLDDNKLIPDKETFMEFYNIFLLFNNLLSKKNNNKNEDL